MPTRVACIITEIYEHPAEQERLQSALDEFSDRVEDAASGVANVGLDGLAAMHGGSVRCWLRTSRCPTT